LMVMVPWGVACFASNSAQQARLGHLAPHLTPALMAMNTSAIYLGQALGAAGGGALLASSGMGALSWAGLAWMLAALALSLWASRRLSIAPGSSIGPLTASVARPPPTAPSPD